WAGGGRERFRTEPTAEDPLTWVERAKLAGEDELARRELVRWADGRERDKATLSQLSYQWADLGEFAEAARDQRESLAFAGDAWDAASAWQRLAGVGRQGRGPHAAGAA